MTIDCNSQMYRYWQDRDMKVTINEQKKYIVHKLLFVFFDFMQHHLRYHPKTKYYTQTDINSQTEGRPYTISEKRGILYLKSSYILILVKSDRSYGIHLQLLLLFLSWLYFNNDCKVTLIMQNILNHYWNNLHQ